MSTGELEGSSVVVADCAWGQCLRLHGLQRAAVVDGMFGGEGLGEEGREGRVADAVASQEKGMFKKRL